MANSLLLADDSPTIAKILLMALQAEAYEIRSVLTAEDALKELKANPPFFFLVDLDLPGKNGYEFARLIKQDAKLKQVRVVLLASAFEPVDEQQFEQCGADALVKKPFDPADLRAKLRKIVDAPPRFPEGTQVRGMLSGQEVLASGRSVKMEASVLLESPDLGGPSGDADSILANLLSESTAAPSLATKTDQTQFTNSTAILDLSGKNALAAPEESILDLSTSFSGTPSAGTAAIDANGSLLLDVLAERRAEELGKLSPSDIPPAFVVQSKSPKAPAAPAAENLSPNAQALAAFFEAEIDAKEQAPPPRPPSQPLAPTAATVPEDDSFDASLSSIDWGNPAADESLSAWSSSPPKNRPDAPPSPPSSPPPRPLEVPRARAPRANPRVENVFFDTGGSSFRFAEDYVQRITKSFTGEANETLPEDHSPTPGAAHTRPASLFPQRSDDRPTNEAPSPGPTGGGAWSQADAQKIEQIVREEVQMIVREVAEKVAWEVIPELAENLIRKELEKVLKEMEK